MIEFSDTMPTDTDPGCAPCEPAVNGYEPLAPVAEPAPIAPPPPPELHFAPPPTLNLGPATPPAPVAVEPVAAAPVVEPAPLVILPDAMEAPAGAPAPGSLVITPEQPTGPTLTIMPDLVGDSSYQPIFPGTSWYDVDAAIGSVGSGGAGSSSGAGALIPHDLTAEGLWPTSDQDGDGIPNASDAAPFTSAPRR